MNKEFLIKLIAEEKEKSYPTIIKTIQTERITEYLNLYKKVKEYEIPIKIKDSYNKNFEGKEAFVENIEILFGDEHSFTVLEIYVDVF